jgi:hypothetical protein
MKSKLSAILFFLFAGIISVSAQVGDLYIVNIKGKIVSLESGETIPYAIVINPRVHGGTNANADGFFSIQILTDDTLIIRSMGFLDSKFILPEFPPKELYTIKLTPVPVLLNEITISEKSNLKEKLGLPNAKPLDIPIELRGTAFNEKPPLLAAFFNPISFAQYYLSEREKQKREVLRIIKDDKQWDKFSTYYNLENIKRLTNLNGEEADKFMIYCNINNRLPFFASQMEIEFQIMDFYMKYQKEKKSPSDTLDNKKP